MRVNGQVRKTDHLFVLGLGPDIRIARYSGLVVNGVRFHTIKRDRCRRTQNSGVVVVGDHNLEEIEFYGVINDIIELQFCGGNHIYLFKCDWWDVGDKRNGIKTYGPLVSVNVNKKWYANDPYVLCNQASQAFYINDVKNGGSWRIVQKTCPRNLYDVPEKEGQNYELIDSNDEPFQQFDASEVDEIDELDEHNMEALDRTDVSPEEIMASAILPRNEPYLDDELSNDDLIDDFTDDDDDTLVDYVDESEKSGDGDDQNDGNDNMEDDDEDEF